MPLQNPLSAELALHAPAAGAEPAARRPPQPARRARPTSALFEIAHLYHAPGGRSRPRRWRDEPWTLGLVLAGRLGGASWRGAGPEADFFTAKGVLETVLRAARRRRSRLEPAAAAVPAPGPRGARSWSGRRRRAGEIGELHPLVGRAVRSRGPRRGVRARPRPARRRRCRPGSATRRSPTSRPCCRTSPWSWTTRSRPSSSSPPRARPGRRCCADVERVRRLPRRAPARRRARCRWRLRLVFQDPERTLTEDEASAVREKVVRALADRFNAELRS